MGNIKIKLGVDVYFIEKQEKFLITLLADENETLLTLKSDYADWWKNIIQTLDITSVSQSIPSKRRLEFDNLIAFLIHDKYLVPNTDFVPPMPDLSVLDPSLFLNKNWKDQRDELHDFSNFEVFAQYGGMGGFAPVVNDTRPANDMDYQAAD